MQMYVVPHIGYAIYLYAIALRKLLNNGLVFFLDLFFWDFGWQGSFGFLVLAFFCGSPCAHELPLAARRAGLLDISFHH